MAGYMAFNRFCKPPNNLLTKVPGRVGTYEIVDSKVETLDISKVKALERLTIKWTLGEEIYFFTSPKSISIIAGETDAGKSAYLANFCSMNMDKFKGRIHLFSSELTVERFAERVQKMDGRPLSDWTHVPFHPRESQYEAAIYPNDINVIDYMELDPSKPYDVGNMIKKIFDKLEKGIAIIGLQMKDGADIAYGGSWSKQKAEFYLTLSRNQEGNFAQIQKAKNWLSRTNPYKLKKKFLLVDGINFYPSKDKKSWYKEGQKNYEEEEEP